MPLCKNFPENLTLSSEHLAVLVRTREAPDCLPPSWTTSCPITHPPPPYPQTTHSPHSFSLLAPLCPWKPLLLRKIPSSLSTCFLSEICLPSQGSQGLAQPQRVYLPPGLSGEVPMWQGSGQGTLWCFPVIPEQSFSLIKTPASSCPGSCRMLLALETWKCPHQASSPLNSLREIKAVSTILDAMCDINSY